MSNIWRIFRVFQKGCVTREFKARSSLVCISGVDENQNCGQRRTICISVDKIHAGYNLQDLLRALPSEGFPQEAGTSYKLNYDRQTFRDQKDEAGGSNQKGFSSSADQFNTEGSSNNDKTDQETGNNWQNWTRSYHDMWSCQHPSHILEAIGWGTVILSGFRISHLFRSSRERREGTENCWLHQVQKLAASVLKQHILHFEVASTVTSVLPRGVFSSLPLSSSVSQHGKQISAAKSTSDAFASISFREPQDVGKVLTVDSVRPKVKVADRSTTTLLDFSTTAASSRNSKIDFDEESRKWHETVRNVTASINNVEGVRLASAGDMEEAVKLWKKAVDEADYAKAHFNLGLAYEQGLGVEKNMEKALRHYSSAAEKDHPASLFNCAMIHLRRQCDVEQNRKIAIDLLEKAAEFGLKEAQRELGVLCTEPSKPDMKRAALLFQRAASQEDMKANYFLGICYENGWGVAKNETTAATLYQKAAMAGHPEAQYNLGLFFEMGKGGLLHDQHKAMELYKLASGCGCVRARQQLKFLQTRLKEEEMEDSFSGTGDKLSSVKCIKLVPPQSSVAPRTHTSFFYRPIASYDSDAMSDDFFSDADSSDLSESSSSSSRESFRYDRPLKTGVSISSNRNKNTFIPKDSQRSGIFFGFSSDDDESSSVDMEPRHNDHQCVTDQRFSLKQLF